MCEQKGEAEHQLQWALLASGSTCKLLSVYCTVTKVTTMCLLYERPAAWECYRLVATTARHGTKTYFDGLRCTGAPHLPPTALFRNAPILQFQYGVQCVNFFLAAWRDFPYCFLGSWSHGSTVTLKVSELAAFADH